MTHKNCNGKEMQGKKENCQGRGKGKGDCGHHQHHRSDCAHHHHGDCHHDHQEELQEFDTITLTLEDDTELECIVLGTFDYKDSNYMALLPLLEEEGEDVYIYEYVEIDEKEVELNVIEDDDLFEEVAKEFEELFVEDEIIEN